MLQARNLIKNPQKNNHQINKKKAKKKIYFLK